ncbi:MAG: serine/threonine-protein kinase, partial [Acidobacteriota bacterium]
MKECQLCKNCFSDGVETCPNDGMPTVHTIAGEPVLEGKYHIECRIGQGGMGVVYKARHAYLKTQLAIKIILPDLVGNDPQLVTRFRQEALAAAAIRHTNVVAVTDYGVVNGTLPFLVMEYVEGESLHDLLARERSLHPERALELMTAICAGVGAAHHQGIVHRDLKPLNVMICSDKPSLSQAVKILDFGLAKIKSGELLGSFIQAQTTGLMGSPYYMAPEQWADDEPDSRSDIYSLGVMLYQMLAGDVPFKGSSIPAIMKKHISDPAPRFIELGITIAPEVEAAVIHTLQKEKEQRTSSVEVLVDELK